MTAAMSGSSQGSAFGGGLLGGAGGIYGALGKGAGAVFGGTLMAGASMEGFNIDRAARYEQTDLALTLTRDVHAMQVGNIKARPDTLSRVGIFEALTDTCFILEIYTCTAAEKEWFKDYLKYHGCTINHISTMATEVDKITSQTSENFVTDFVRGNLLRCNLDDPHMANELSIELMKGVYIKLGVYNQQ
jgi:hypothetical protein